MVSPKRLAWLALAVPSIAVPYPDLDLSQFTQPLIDSGLGLSVLAAKALAKSLALAATNPQNGCTIGKIKYRREWRSLSKNERRNFITAVKCLQTSPSLYDPAFMPGAKSLFDDFVGVHLLQTINIHATATFLTWHRYFIHAYEQRLQACGYTGALPYWEWGLDVNNPAASPVFDGSDTSLGGNGEAIPHAGIPLSQPGVTNIVNLPPGSGGGCVRTGPFADMVVHLGPVALPQYGSTNFTSAANPLADNPRCLKRDLNSGVAKRWSTFRNTTNLITQYNTIELFQAFLQGDTRYVLGELGVHGGGHYTIGGDPGGDPFISPGDPAFYLHHGQVDRVYWIWQMLDFDNRQGVHGTSTLQDMPPSANVTVEDTIDISPIIGSVQIKKLMNTVGNTPFCYVYL